MQTETLGRTGLTVGKLALGGLFVRSGSAELDEAKRVVRQAVESGVNYIDTAPGYGDSEAVLGKCLAAIESPVVISTKLGGRPQPFDPRDVGALRRSVEESLQLLGRDVIDILMIHEPDRPGQYDWWTDMRAVDGPVLDLLDALKREGKIRFTGLGGTTTTEMAHLCRSGKFDVVLTAFNYSLLWNEAALEVIPAAQAAGMGIVVGSPLQQGALAVKHSEAVNDPGVYWLSAARREQFKALYDLVDELDIPLPELALRFVISHPDVDCTLMGARSADEVRLNVAAVNNGPLPADVLDRITRIQQQVPFRPCEESLWIGGRLANPGGYKGPGGLR